MKSYAIENKIAFSDFISPLLFINDGLETEKVHLGQNGSELKKNSHIPQFLLRNNNRKDSKVSSLVKEVNFYDQEHDIKEFPGLKKLNSGPKVEVNSFYRTPTKENFGLVDKPKNPLNGLLYRENKVNSKTVLNKSNQNFSNWNLLAKEKEEKNKLSDLSQNSS